MIGVFGTGTGPAHGHSTETRNDKEDFAFVSGIRIWTEGKHERASGHEVREFRDFSREFRRRLDLGIAEMFLEAGRRVRGSDLFGLGGFKLLDTTQCFSVGSDEIIVLFESKLVDARGCISTIIRRGDRSWVPFGRHGSR